MPHVIWDQFFFSKIFPVACDKTAGTTQKDVGLHYEVTTSGCMEERHGIARELLQQTKKACVVRIPFDSHTGLIQARYKIPGIVQLN